MLEVKRATQLHRELTMEVATKTKAGTTFRNRNPNSSPRSKHQWCIQLTHLIQWGGPLYGRHPHRQQHEVAYGALGPAGRTQDQSGGVEFSYLARQKKNLSWHEPVLQRSFMHLILTSALTSSFLCNNSWTSSALRLKMAWTRGGCNTGIRNLLSCCCDNVKTTNTLIRRDELFVFITLRAGHFLVIGIQPFNHEIRAIKSC